MQVSEDFSEVSYTVCIPSFYEIKDVDINLDSSLSVSSNSFRSEWKLTIIPFFSVKPEDDLPENRDVAIRLQCTSCNAPLWFLDDFEIVSSVVNHPQHERHLSKAIHPEDGLFSCHGVVIPRVSIRAFHLLVDGDLKLQLRFILPSSVLNRVEDGVVKLSEDLRKLQLETKNADVTIISSDGVRLPAHVSILLARSNLANDIHRNRVGDHLQSDAVDSTNIHEAPLFRPSAKENLEGGCKNGANFSPIARTSSLTSSTTTQRLSYKRAFSMSPRTCVSSPRKSVNTPVLQQRKASMLTHSPFKQKNEGSEFYKGSFRTPKGISPLCKTSAPLVDPPSPALKRHDVTPLKVLTPAKTTDDKDSNAAIEITVNMSSSVAQQVLQWIYTGSCSNMYKLAKPLLVAGIRYDVPSLTRAAELSIASTMTPTNVPDILLLCNKYSAPVLQKMALDYAICNACEVTAQETWPRISESCPEIMLQFSRRLAKIAS